MEKVVHIQLMTFSKDTSVSFFISDHIQVMYFANDIMTLAAGIPAMDIETFMATLWAPYLILYQLN